VVAGGNLLFRGSLLVAKKKLVWLLGAVLVLLFLIAKQWPDGRLHLIFCDVGQGDAILIVQGSNQLLIDGGPNERVLACLGKHLPFWDRKIETVVLTHPERDHFTGLIAVLSRYRVENFVANPFGLKHRQKFKELVELLNEQKIRTTFLHEGGKICWGKISFDILWPSKEKQFLLENLPREKYGSFSLVEEKLLSPNEFSLVGVLRYGNFQALLTGDMPVLVSQILVWRQEIPRVDVLKAPHHGAGKDNPWFLYQATQPQLVVISVGKNQFGHPSEKLLKKLEEEKIPFLRTDKRGTIEIVSDGKSWFLKN